MKQIAVEKSNKAKEVTLHFEDHTTITLSEEDFLRMNLYEREDLTDQEMKEIVLAKMLSSAKSIAIRYVSLKFRCEKEVRNKLEGEKYENNILDSVINELKALGYLNDALYVQKYLHDRNQLKPKAKRLVRMELIAKGIQEEIIDEVFDEWHPDETVIALNLVKRKFGKYDMHDQQIVKKILSFLRHRGFNHETLHSVVRSLDIEFPS